MPPYYRDNSNPDQRTALHQPHELLQRPPPRKPATSRQISRQIAILARLKVIQIHITHLNISVPRKHGAGRLGQPGAAGLVDAARVDPDGVESAARAGEGACLVDLTEARTTVQGKQVGGHDCWSVTSSASQVCEGMVEGGGRCELMNSRGWGTVVAVRVVSRGLMAMDYPERKRGGRPSCVDGRAAEQYH